MTDIPDRLGVRADDGSRLTFTRDERGRVSLAVGQCPDRSVSVRLPGAEWERVRAWGGEADGIAVALRAFVADIEWRRPIVREKTRQPWPSGVAWVLDELLEYADRLTVAPVVPTGPGDTTRQDEITTAARWVVTLWNDWPQERRAAVGQLSEHLYDALVALTTVVRDGMAPAVDTGPGDTVPRAPVEALLAAGYDAHDAVTRCNPADPNQLRFVFAALDAWQSAAREVQRHLDGDT